MTATRQLAARALRRALARATARTGGGHGV